MESIASWALDTGNSRGCQNHYLLTMDLYWHVRLLLGKIIMDRRQTQVNLMHRLDEHRDIMLDMEGRPARLEM